MHEIPGDVVALLSFEIVIAKSALLFWGRPVPAEAGVVVMGAGVGDAILWIVVGEKIVFQTIIESKLKDLHSG